MFIVIFVSITSLRRHFILTPEVQHRNKNRSFVAFLELRVYACSIEDEKDVFKVPSMGLGRGVFIIP